MSIHVCKCEHSGNYEFHLRYPGMLEETAQRLASRINAGELDSDRAGVAKRLAAVEEERDAVLGLLAKIAVNLSKQAAEGRARDDELAAAKAESETLKLSIAALNAAKDAALGRRTESTQVGDLKHLLYYLGYCSSCNQEVRHHIDEPFATCGCGTGEDATGPGVIQQLRIKLADAEKVVNSAVLSPGWASAPPTKSGWYWHWNGDKDSEPLPTSVLRSATNSECFVSEGQLGLTQAVTCREYGGYWIPITAPSINL